MRLAILVALSWLVLHVFAESCDNSQLDYTFTSCLNGMRKAIFFWKSSSCTNAVPSPVEGISCETICAAGQYLGVDVAQRAAKCQDCPSNTYSTGSALRLSSADKNWNRLPKESELNCYWVTDQGYWQYRRCESFLPLQDNTAIRTNMGETKDETWNILEFKLNVYLIQDGTVEFTYRKASKVADGTRNGRFRFDVGFFNIINDDDPSSAGQTTKVPLKKGLNELMWYYAFSTAIQHEDLYFELSEIEITPVYYSSFLCLPCKSAYSAAGSSECSGCSANHYSASGTANCVACAQDSFSYPGDTGCRIKPKCNVAYDAEPVFQQCVNGKRTVTYQWRKDTICNTAASNLPASQSVDCATCQRGSFINRANNSACTPCANGYYSSEANQESCVMCPSGKYAPMVESYEDLETMPSGFETFCEPVQTEARDLCAFHRGWIIANNSFTVLPSVPTGVRLVLKKKVNMTQESRYMQFAFEYLELGAATPSEQLKLKLDGYTIDIPLQSAGETKQVALSAGTHTVEWIYEKTKENSDISPLLITSVRIEGEKGSSDTCIQCPRGQYSSTGSAKCVACEPGFKPNSEGTNCGLCEEGTFKSGQMSICETCPAHTRSTNARTKCELYEGYNFGEKYMLNMVKFDSTRNSSINELKDTTKSGSFFGPVFNASEIYFFSLSKPMEYDVEKYEYEEDDVCVDEGHVFVLMAGVKHDAENVVTSKDSVKKTHYRIKKNLGSKLQSVDIKELERGKITLEYVDGDECEAGKRHESKVTLACDKSVQSLSRIEYVTEGSNKCLHNFVWRTPYACSQCRLAETAKYYAKCINSKRTIYLEDGGKCIIHGYGAAGQQAFWVETMKLNGTTIMAGANDSSVIDLLAATNTTSSDFIYADEYIEDCSDVELSYVLIFALIGVLVVVVVIAIITVVVSLRYRKKYYQLLDQKSSDSHETKNEQPKPAEAAAVAAANNKPELN